MADRTVSGLNITLLGTPRIERRGKPVSLPRRRTRSLLYFLAASPGSHGRDELVEILWPNLSRAKGRRQLSDALSDLRRALGVGAVESDTERVALNPAQCDTHEFVAAVDGASRRGGQDAEAHISKALDLYGGEFLAGLSIDGSETFTDWIQEQRLSHSLSALGAYARLASLRLDAGDAAAAIRVAQRGLELDHLREDLWRILIQGRSDLGDRQGALAEYARCKETLHRELGVAPEAETEALRRRLTAERGTPAAGASEARAARARPPLPFSFRIPGGSLALVGRERELASLLHAWQAVCDGTSQLVVVAGEPGIGKSRLAVEFATRAAGSGATVLAARCPDLHEPPPYGPIEEAIRAVLPAMPPGGFKDLGPEWLPWIGRLLPELGLGVPPPERMAPEEEKTRLAEGAGKLLDVISDASPLLLVVEDIHWAHGATIQLLHALVRRGRPLMILATMRDTEPQTEGTIAATRVLADLSKEGLATPISLRALGPRDTETLVRLALESGHGGATVNALAVAKLAKGQPLFALELTRAVLESPEAPDLPESLMNAIGARVRRTSEFAKRVLDVAAVVGRPSTLQLLGRAVGVDASDDSLINAGEELIARRLLDEDESGGLVPSHGLIQAAVYRSLSVSRRRALHGRVAIAIESGGEVPSGVRSEVLARHYRLAGDLSRAAEHLLTAGERAQALGEVDTAAARFRSASTLLRKGGRDREAALAIERSGKAVWRTCDIAVATAAFTEAIDIWSGLSDNEGSLARLHAAMAQIVTRWGYLITDPADVQFHVDAAIRLTAGTSAEERSLALSARAFARAYSNDLDAAAEDAQAALDLAHGSDVAWHSAMDAISLTANEREDWRAGLDATIERLERATRQNDAFELYDAGMTAFMVAEILGDMATAAEYARLVERAGVETGQPGKVFHAWVMRAELLVSEQRWPEAEEMIARVIDDPEGFLDRPSYSNMKNCLVAQMLARRGDLAQARGLIQGVPEMPHYGLVWYGRVKLAYERAQTAIQQSSVREGQRPGANNRPRRKPSPLKNQAAR